MPSTNSIAMYSASSTLPSSKTCAIFGWTRRAVSFASSMNIAMKVSSCDARCGRIRLITTFFWKPCSPGEVATNSSAMPPMASRSTSWYRPKPTGKSPTREYQHYHAAPCGAAQAAVASISAGALERVRHRAVETIEVLEREILVAGELGRDLLAQRPARTDSRIWSALPSAWSRKPAVAALEVLLDRRSARPAAVDDQARRAGPTASIQARASRLSSTDGVGAPTSRHRRDLRAGSRRPACRPRAARLIRSRSDCRPGRGEGIERDHGQPLEQPGQRERLPRRSRCRRPRRAARAAAPRRRTRSRPRSRTAHRETRSCARARGSRPSPGAAPREPPCAASVRASTRLATCAVCVAALRRAPEAQRRALEADDPARQDLARALAQTSRRAGSRRSPVQRYQADPAPRHVTMRPGGTLKLRIGSAH